LDNEEDFEKIPHFGNSQSAFEQVINFYAFWESYSTKKSYAWLFTHNINEIRDRRVLKLVDKEHKKIQQKARKERNEEVRSLVQFVKKRDKRMLEYRKMLEEKAQQNRIKSQQNRLDTIRKRNELIKEQQQNSQVKTEHEEQLKQLEESYFNQYTDSEYTDDEGDEVQENFENDANLGDQNAFDDELYCVACNKFFNSESSKKNHEASKKHKQNLELLRSEMVNEEEKYKENCEEALASLEIDEDIEDDDQPEPEKKSKAKKSKKKNKKAFQTSSELKTEDIASDHSIDEDQYHLNMVHLEEDDDWSNGKKSVKKTKAKPTKTKNEKPVVLQTTEKVEPDPVQPAECKEDEVPNSEDLSCATCHEKFPSKNKLFNHLKKTNHSIYLGETKTKTGEKLSSKKKK
jgi:DnaJ homolog subfamily A member 5